MNTSTLKSYAPEARQAFITAVSAQASRLGISATEIQPAQAQGDVLLIAGQAFPLLINESRNKLVERVRAHGFDATMDAVAYTWFNRFVAIRYMELHGYMDHGYRVLSHPEGLARPEILDHAADVELPGLDKAKAIELKLDGTQDEALYRLLLKAQCNALHQAMPFLFEKIGDETELLLPANLLHSDSLIRQLVEQVDETLWQDIEVIGWLYQFYISEKKDQVIGKVVKSEDIPAATQLFTPNWIVKYMVQNSLGAQWLATYPQSPLKAQMEYYIEPAKQTDAVNAQLAAITPTQLNPEELTLIDPASGSGHILVEAYDLFKAIYLERGYRLRDVPQLILEKNLFGLDIDQRAAQLTGFALMMKGRADDRRLFEREVKLNVMALVDSTDFDAEGLSQNVTLADYDLKPGHLTELKQLFEHATTFGSLIQVPEALAEKLPALKQLSETATSSPDLFAVEALKCLGPLVQQAELLAAQYDAVVANPPYMTGKYQTQLLREYLSLNYEGYEKDFFLAFIDRNLAFSKMHGRLGLMTPFVWMFIASHEHLRSRLIKKETIASLVQLEYSGFAGATVPVCTLTLQKGHTPGLKGCYIRLSDFPGSGIQSQKTLEAIRNRDCGWLFETCQDQFKKIPGGPIVYWASLAVFKLFSGKPLFDITLSDGQNITADNDKYLRQWWEVDSTSVSKENKWLPYAKGGPFRKWCGNITHIIDWSAETRTHYTKSSRCRIIPEYLWYRPGITWSRVTSSYPSFRALGENETFDKVGSSVFLKDSKDIPYVLGLLNSLVSRKIFNMLNPTLDLQVKNVRDLPQPSKSTNHSVIERVNRLTTMSAADWGSSESSRNYQSTPILMVSSEPISTLESSYNTWITKNRDTIAEMKRLEEENNRLFIDAYGLADELTPEVPVEQITLTVNPAYRYGKKLSEEELWTRFRQDSMEELVSYAIGCMMGRYSLDARGLIYAHSGNAGFDATRYTTFPADDDGIVPLTDTEWFDDDAANRLVEFVSVAWDASKLEANLTFLADNLSPKANESSRDTIRRYLCDKFFKDHLQTYKKRPIYWLFTSGKQKAFSCLVYLHRYNEGTLSRMRSEYVIPLQGKMAARLDQLKGDIQAATSTAHSKRLEKEQTKLEKQQVELIAFDEKLRHYADKRIALDLDDGVKVNYGQFGDLLAEVKAIHGKKPATV